MDLGQIENVSAAAFDYLFRLTRWLGTGSLRGQMLPQKGHEDWSKILWQGLVIPRGVQPEGMPNSGQEEELMGNPLRRERFSQTNGFTRRHLCIG
ncbi:MAG: hypothetical protein KA257_07400, partial [Opitutaceae bacterium]|nr:hypothetical protein [Opitutaceae bacterium]